MAAALPSASTPLALLGLHFADDVSIKLKGKQRHPSGRVRPISLWLYYFDRSAPSLFGSVSTNTGEANDGRRAQLPLTQVVELLQSRAAS